MKRSKRKFVEEESESEIVPPSAKSGARSAQSARSVMSAMSAQSARSVISARSAMSTQSEISARSAMTKKSGRVGGRSKRTVVEEVEENLNRPRGCGIQKKRKSNRKEGNKKKVCKPHVGKYIVFIHLCLSHLHRFCTLLLSLRRLPSPF